MDVKRTLGAAHYMLYAMATLLINDGISTCTHIMSFCVPSDPISTLPTLGLKDRSFWSFLCGETGWSGTTTCYAILRTYVVVGGCGYRKKEKEEKTNKPEYI